MTNKPRDRTSPMPAERAFVKIKRCIGSSMTKDGYLRNKWEDVETLVCTPDTNEPFNHDLPKGGCFQVHPNMIKADELKEVGYEILKFGKFRQHDIQNQEEPRVHCLLHEEATSDDFETSRQPGYRYANVCLKARPLSKLPLLHKIARRLADKFGVKEWEIGVHPVLYRDGNDKMGPHADNDQGEKVILSLVVYSPKEPRRVLIQPVGKGGKVEVGDEKIELFLQPGDVFAMDGKMQDHYLHSVPKRDKKTDETDGEVYRLSVIFRSGTKVYVTKDSGKPCANLCPKVRTKQVFGNMIEGLVEGQTYRRREMFEKSYHRMPQSGVSGNIKGGTDAIVVSGLKDDHHYDSFFRLAYTAQRSKGGKALARSYETGKPVRVFRSSIYESPYGLIPPKGCKKTRYRYDGLYRVVYASGSIKDDDTMTFELKRMSGKRNQIPNTKVLKRFRKLGTMYAGAGKR